MASSAQPLQEMSMHFPYVLVFLSQRKDVEGTEANLMLVWLKFLPITPAAVDALTLHSSTALCLVVRSLSGFHRVLSSAACHGLLWFQQHSPESNPPIKCVKYQIDLSMLGFFLSPQWLLHLRTHFVHCWIWSLCKHFQQLHTFLYIAFCKTRNVPKAFYSSGKLNYMICRWVNYIVLNIVKPSYFN